MFEVKFKLLPDIYDSSTFVEDKRRVIRLDIFIKHQALAPALFSAFQNIGQYSYTELHVINRKKYIGLVFAHSFKTQGQVPRSQCLIKSNQLALSGNSLRLPLYMIQFIVPCCTRRIKYLTMLDPGLMGRSIWSMLSTRRLSERRFSKADFVQFVQLHTLTSIYFMLILGRPNITFLYLLNLIICISSLLSVSFYMWVRTSPAVQNPLHQILYFTTFCR